VSVPGVTVAAHPLLMSDLDATVAIVRAALELAGV
jgi:LPPG:FO 2-phospho-L-lactate transferase